MTTDSNRSELEDGAFLDQCLGEFVEAIQNGVPPDVDRLVEVRPSLAADIHGLRALAQEVAVQRPAVPRLASHELLGELGRGGMGVVFLARDRNLPRTVALKVLAPALSGDARGKERFLREPRNAARLKHPGIVPIHEVGEAEGVAYFTMDLVDGGSMAQALRALRAMGKVPAALQAADFARAVLGGTGDAPPCWGSSHVVAVCQIVLQVARALQHAHSQGVTHRDVKPSNILLRRDGSALLSDFGLARGPGDASLTRSGDVVGTPLYMAPEQVDARFGAVDAQSDVFALGVTLYEALTLAPAFAGDSPELVLGAITGREPLPPARRNPAIARDLETVCTKALAKTKTQRYATAGAFADDLERFLTLRPILARPTGVATRTLRFVQRNRALTAFVTTALLLVLGAPTALWLQQRVANVQLQSEVKKGTELFDMLASTLTAADPGGAGAEARVVDMLWHAERELRQRFADQPEVKAKLLRLLAQTYVALQLPGRAEPLLVEALDLGERSLPVDDALTLTIAYDLGEALADHDQPDRAERHLRAWLARARAARGDADDITMSFEHNLGYVALCRGNCAEAERIYRPLLERRRRNAIDDHMLLTKMNLGLAMTGLGKYQAAEELLNETLAERIRRQGEDHPATLHVQHNVVDTLVSQAKYRQAEPIVADLCAKTTRAYGPSKPRTLWRIGMHAEVLRGLEQWQAAEDLLVPAVRDADRLLAADHETTLQLHFKLGRLRRSQGRLPEAEAEYAIVRDRRGTKHGPTDVRTLDAAYSHSAVLADQQRHAEAEAELRSIVTAARAWGDDDRQRWVFESGLGWCLLQRCDAAGAAPILAASHAHLRRLVAPDAYETLSALRWLTQAYAALGDADRQHACEQELARVQKK